MSETVQYLLEQIKEAAVVLEDSNTIDLITAVQNQSSISKLRLLIVGSTGSGRFSVANVILGQPKLLPTSPIPKAAITLGVGYGKTVTVEVAAKNGVKTAMEEDKLRTFLTSPDTDATAYESIEVKTNCDLLKTCEIRIENIKSQTVRV